MEPVEGVPGLWRCPNDPDHEFAEEVKPDAEPVAISDQPQAPAPYWLEHLGLHGPIPQVPLTSSPLDGARCQPLGPIAPGGSKSAGRKKRKKKPRNRDPIFGY
jgi:hypothetical protein